MRAKLAVLVATVGLLLAAPAWAHQAFSAEFDIDMPLKLQGTLVKWEMINPHSLEGRLAKCGIQLDF